MEFCFFVFDDDGNKTLDPVSLSTQNDGISIVLLMRNVTFSFHVFALSFTIPPVSRLVAVCKHTHTAVTAPPTQYVFQYAHVRMCALKSLARRVLVTPASLQCQNSFKLPGWARRSPRLRATHTAVPVLFALRSRFSRSMLLQKTYGTSGTYSGTCIFSVVFHDFYLILSNLNLTI